MMILTITLGLLLAVYVGRFGWQGLADLAYLKLKGRGIVSIACLAQCLSVVGQLYRYELVVLSTVLLALFCWLNRRQAGFVALSLGIALNMTVMLLNGGLMPINQATLAQMEGVSAAEGSELRWSKDRVQADGETVLPWLGDRLLLPGALARLAAWSLGDICILLGVAQLLWVSGGNAAQRRLAGAPAPIPAT